LDFCQDFDFGEMQKMIKICFNFSKTFTNEAFLFFSTTLIRLLYNFGIRKSKFLADIFNLLTLFLRIVLLVSKWICFKHFISNRVFESMDFMHYEK